MDLQAYAALADFDAKETLSLTRAVKILRARGFTISKWQHGVVHAYRQIFGQHSAHHRCEGIKLRRALSLTQDRWVISVDVMYADLRETGIKHRRKRSTK
jgi:hypothetical protein